VRGSWADYHSDRRWAGTRTIAVACTAEGDGCLLVRIGPVPRTMPRSGRSGAAAMPAPVPGCCARCHPLLRLPRSSHLGRAAVREAPAQPHRRGSARRAVLAICGPPVATMSATSDGGHDSEARWVEEDPRREAAPDDRIGNCHLVPGDRIRWATMPDTTRTVDTAPADSANERRPVRLDPAGTRRTTDPRRRDRAVLVAEDVIAVRLAARALMLEDGTRFSRRRPAACAHAAWGQSAREWRWG
jgi:hypothetical protein